MSTQDQPSGLNTELLFEKCQSYFDKKFEAISNSSKDDEDTTFKEFKNQLEAQQLTKTGNVPQFTFCGQLEIQLSKTRVAILQKNDIQKAIDAIQEMEELIAKIKK